MAWHGAGRREGCLPRGAGKLWHRGQPDVRPPPPAVTPAPHPRSPMSSGLPAGGLSSWPLSKARRVLCQAGLGPPPEVVSEVGRGLVNELKLSEPGPGSPSVSSWPRDRLAGLSA